MIKKRANFIHFRKRLFERYLFDITNTEYDKLCKDIYDNKMQDYIEERESRTRIWYNIPFNGETIRCLYDGNQHNLITVLPKKYPLDSEEPRG